MTRRPGKPHPEQDQIEGLRDAWPVPRVGRMTLLVTEGLERWSPSFSGRIQNSAYRFTWPRFLSNLSCQGVLFQAFRRRPGKEYLTVELTFRAGIQNFNPVVKFGGLLII